MTRGIFQFPFEEILFSENFAEELKPDIVLMDVSMPGLNGLLATAKLKRVMPDAKILTLTRHTDEAYLQELLQAGVSGYVLKQSASTELLRAIRAVAKGDKYLDPIHRRQSHRRLRQKTV